jgi:hypothetical protein
VVEGQVKALWRFPVLGMRGESLRSSQIDTRGVTGDRQHFASGPEGMLSAHDLPRLSRWQATFPFNPDSVMARDRPPPFPQLVGPSDRTWRWRDPRLFNALERDLGRRVDLQRDLELTRGVIVSASELAAPAEAGVNLQLELELPPGGWAGRELSFRDGVRLRLVASRADGPGIEARVVESGRVVVGEPVVLS